MYCGAVVERLPVVIPLPKSWELDYYAIKEKTTFARAHNRVEELHDDKFAGDRNEDSTALSWSDIIALRTTEADKCEIHPSELT